MAPSFLGCNGIPHDSVTRLPPTPAISVPLADVTPELGSDADHLSWRGAARITHLLPALVAKPEESDVGIPPNPKRLALETEVLLMWQATTLYVRFICRDEDIYAPYDQQRDAPHYMGDVVEVFIDAVGDGRQWFEIQVNPNGGVLDLNTVMSISPRSDELGLLTDESNRNYWSNRSYDLTGLRTATRRIEDGWIADFALPASVVLRRHEDRSFSAGQTLRLNLIRYDRPITPPGANPTRPGMGCWSPVVFGRPHRSPDRMGEISLVDELLPQP